MPVRAFAAGHDGQSPVFLGPLPRPEMVCGPPFAPFASASVDSGGHSARYGPFLEVHACNSWVQPDVLGLLGATRGKA